VKAQEYYTCTIADLLRRLGIAQLEVLCVLISRTRGTNRGEESKAVYIGLYYILLRAWHINGLDLSNVVQVALACLGMGSNCRRLLLYERLAYN
jgi:hypothetical protein